MAISLNTSAFGNGLLGGLNKQMANDSAHQQADLDYGDKQLFSQFEGAAKEYDDEKASQQNAKQSIDNIAKSLSSSLGHPIGPWAYSTASDAYNLGYTKPEHFGYVQDAGEKTYRDQLSNPDKWNVETPAPTVYDRDSDPRMTAILQKFGDNRNLQQLEQIRNRTVQQPYSNMPGANWGNPDEYAQQQAQKKSSAQATGRIEAQTSPEGVELANLKAKIAKNSQLSQYGYNPDGTPTQQGQPQQPQSGASNGNAQPSTPNNMSQQQPPAPVSASAGTPNQPQAPDTSGMQMSASQLQQPQQAQGQPPAATPTPNTATSQGAQNNSAPNATPQQSPQQNLPPEIQALQKQLGAKGRNWDTMSKLSPQDQQRVLAMSEGDEQLPGRYKQSPHDAMLWAAARQFDPSVNEERFKAKDKFTSGQDANTIQAINVAMNHISVLKKVSDDLNNGDVPAANSLMQMYQKQTGNAGPVTFDATRGYVAQELRKIYSNSQGGSLTELEQIEQSLNKNLAPAQMNGVFRNTADLLDGKMDGLNAKYQRTMGLAYTPQGWMTPNANASYDSLKSYNSKGQPVDKFDNPIPQAAIEYLKSNPQTADMFKQQFGRDASMYVKMSK